MTQYEWINKVVRTTPKPFLCGGYTQHDWDTLNGAFCDYEYLDNYCDALEYDKVKMSMTIPDFAVR